MGWYVPYDMGGVLWGFVPIWPFYVRVYHVVKKMQEMGSHLSSSPAAVDSELALLAEEESVTAAPAPVRTFLHGVQPTMEDKPDMRSASVESA